MVSPSRVQSESKTLIGNKLSNRQSNKRQQEPATSNTRNGSRTGGIIDTTFVSLDSEREPKLQNMHNVSGLLNNTQ